MAIFEVAADRIRKIEETSFSQAGLKERADLQRLLRTQPEVVAPGTLIIAEEFGNWEDSKRRIDLLGIDKDATLVVIELKRSEDGGHMELQAIRYAAMVSTMTFDSAVEVFENFLRKNHNDANARELLLDFLDEEPGEAPFPQGVRIVLVSAEFSKELTGTVMWLNEQGLDIRCVRIKPYLDNGRVLIDVQQVIPLPEAAEYQVQLRKKEQADRQERAERYGIRKKFWQGLLDRAVGRTDLHANISPSEYNWIGASSGVRGLNFVYSLRKNEATAELYIDRGADEAETNKRIFDFLNGQHSEIEQAFGGNLRWQRLDDRRGSRISSKIARGGWANEESQWPAIHDDMIAAMIRLEKALTPQLEKVRNDILAKGVSL